MFDEKDLPIVLVHGTMGRLEDWSRVVEELSNSRSVIRPNYIERVAGRNSINRLAVQDLADEVVAAVRAEGKQRFDLVGGSLGAAVAICIAAEYPQTTPRLAIRAGRPGPAIEFAGSPARAEHWPAFADYRRAVAIGYPQTAADAASRLKSQAM